MSKKIFTPENVFHPGLRSILNDLNCSQSDENNNNKDLFEDLVISNENKSKENSGSSFHQQKQNHRSRRHHHHHRDHREHPQKKYVANTSVQVPSSSGLFSNIWIVSGITMIILFILFIIMKPSFCYQDDNNKLNTQHFSWLIALIWSIVIGFLPIVIYYGYNLFYTNNNSNKQTVDVPAPVSKPVSGLVSEPVSGHVPVSISGHVPAHLSGPMPMPMPMSTPMPNNNSMMSNNNLPESMQNDSIPNNSMSESTNFQHN